MSRTSIEVAAVAPADWADVVALFGANGACGGCWCRYWQQERGADWDSAKGARNRGALRREVSGGAAGACLAREDGVPVGWCRFGPRSSFPRLLRGRAVQTDAGPDDWAVVCFFVPARHRGRGVARALLEGAVRAARAAGARSLEGYPVDPGGQPGGRYPATFAYVGVPRLYERAGFRDVTPAGSRRAVYRRRLRPARTAGQP